MGSGHSPPSEKSLIESCHNCHPTAIKSRRYSKEDLTLINDKLYRLVKEGIIEPSQSPWQAQVIVTKEKNHKKCLAINYSQSINLFIQLDAFPFPSISFTVNDIAQYKVFSTLDLQTAYHQLPLKDDEKPYTVFKAKGRLYQFTQLPFSITN